MASRSAATQRVSLLRLGPGWVSFAGSSGYSYHASCSEASHRAGRSRRRSEEPLATRTAGTRARQVERPGATRRAKAASL